jgi:hypothetical protein
MLLCALALVRWCLVCRGRAALTLTPSRRAPGAARASSRSHTPTDDDSDPDQTQRVVISIISSNRRSQHQQLATALVPQPAAAARTDIDT